VLGSFECYRSLLWVIFVGLFWVLLSCARGAVVNVGLTCWALLSVVGLFCGSHLWVSFE